MAEPVAATQSAGQGFVGISVENSTATVSNGFNLSLLKSATFLQAGVGFLITTSVVAATVFAFVVFGLTVTPDYPIAPVINREMFKGTKLTIDAVAECKDKRNANLTLDSVGQGNYGHVIIRGGKAVYDLSKSPYYSGYDTFNYTVSNDQFKVTSYVMILIKNHVPEAVPMKFNILKNSKSNKAYVFDTVGTNGLKISDIDGDELKIVNITTPSHGVAQVHDRYIEYTPDFQFNGLDSFNYTISDNNDTASEVIYFQIDNAAPKAKEDFYSEPKNTILTLNVLENDMDPNFDDLNITSVDRCQRGSVRIAEDNKHVIYSPIRTKATYSDSFEYTITDGVLSSSAYVIVEIKNRPPVAQDVSVSVFKNSKVGVSFPLSFSDPDSLETVSLVSIANPAKGGITYTTQKSSKSGTFLNDLWIVYDWFDYQATYIPTPGKTGVDTFTYTVSDSADEGKATITVEIINQAPVATNATTSLNKRASVDVKVSPCTDDNGDTCVLKRVVSPTRNGGTVIKIDDDTLRYTAPQTGQATSDYIEFVLIDKQEDASAALEANGHVEVKIINQPPVAKPVTAVARKGIEIDIELDGEDPTNDILTFHSFSYDKDYKQTNLSINLGASTGKVKDTVHFYTLRQSYQEIFSFYVKDEQGLRSEQPATVTVTVTNDKPEAVADSITTHWRTAVRADLVANDVDSNPGDKEKLTVREIVAQPTKGSVVISGREIIYTPKGEQAGTDTFTYLVFDGEDYSDNAAVVTVTLTNDAPTPANDAYTKHHRNNPVLFEVIANDTDPNSDPISMVSFTTVTTPHGQASLTNQNGKSFISYTSNNNFVGTDTFTYAITDGDKQGTATVSVTSTNTAPVTKPDSFDIHWNSKTKTVNLLANDNDPDNDPLSLKPASLVTSNGFRGSISIADAAAGTVTFTTSNDFKGSQSVTYTATDGPSETTGTLDITVTNNDVPKTQTPISRRVQWRALQAQPIIIPALAQQTDSDGDSLSLSVVSGPVTKEGTDSLKYVYTGVKTETFTYRISDGLDSADSTGTVEVFNTRPTCQNVNDYVIVAGSSRVLNVIAISNDVDGDPLTLDNNPSAVGPSDKRAPVVTRNAAGNLNIATLDAGNFLVSYTVSDSITSSTTCTVAVKVTSVDDKQYDVHWSKYAAGEVLQVLSGLQLTNLRLTGATGASNGTTTIAGYPTNTVTYKPVQGFIGVDTFTATYTYEATNIPSSINVFVSVYDNAPSAQPKTASMHWLKLRNPGATVNLLTGASDPDGNLDTVTYKDKTDANKGGVTVAGGVATYKANVVDPAFLGDDTFTYTVTDGLKVSTPAVVTITATNTKPTTVAKTVQMTWREHKAGKTIDVLTGDSAGDDGETLSLVGVTKPTIIESATPTGNQVTVKGDDMAGKSYSLPYTVTDGAETVAGSVTVQVTNTAPSCTAFANSYHWRTAQAGITFNPTDQCTDNENDPLSFVQPLSAPLLAGSTLTVNGNQITYRPRANNLATDTFTVQITDGPSTTAKPYSLSFTNAVPTSTGVNAGETHWRNSIAMNAACSDTNNDPLTYVRTSEPTKGTLTAFNAATGAATYKPNADIAFGPGTGKITVTDSYKFKCSDVVSESTENTATVTIFNNAPTAPALTYTFARDYTVTPTRTLNIFGQEQSNPKPTDADANDVAALTVVSAGTAAQIAAVKPGGQAIEYTFTQAYVGQESFSYVVSDGNYRTTGQITVQITNAAPVCSNVAVTVQKGRSSTPSILNTLCTDANKDPITFALPSTNCGKGTIALSKDSNGKDVVTYTPRPNRSGSDQCAITARDGIVSTTFYLQVTITNNAPTVAQAKAFTYKKMATQQTYTFTVLDGTSDPDGDTLALVSIADVSNCFATRGGTLTIVGNTVVYKTSTSFVGTCSFTYTYSDQDQDQPLTATGTVSVSIYNDPPVAVNDYFTVKQSETFTKNVAELLANDYDVNGDPISFVSITCKANDPTYCKRTPTVTSGVITIPTAGKTCSTIIFDYTIQTPDGLQATATVTVQDVECKCFKAIDLAFVLDGSGSVGSDNWVKSKEFVNAIVSKFNIGPGADQSRVAVVQFGNAASYTYDSHNYCYNYEEISWRGVSSWKQYCRTISKLGIPFTDDMTTATNRIASLNYLSEGTFTHWGLRIARDYVRDFGRTGVDKVMIVFTDGAANVPCDCYECRNYQGFGSDASCQNSYWPGQTCSQCSWSPDNGKWCMPCAEPRALAASINANAGWRIVSVGVGDGLPPVGWAQVQGLAYNPSASFKIDWNSLNDIYNAVVQSSCYA